MRFFLKNLLPEEWIQYIEFYSKKIQYESDEYVIKEGLPVKGIYFINTGKLKIVKKINEKDIILRFAADNDILGHRGLGEPQKEYCFSAVCYTKTTVTFIPMPVFEQLLKTNPTVTYQFLLFFASELKEVEDLIAKPPVINRVAKALVKNFEVFGTTKNNTKKLSFTIPRKDIASYAQTTYESVIRSLNELHKSGLIELHGKDIHILKLDDLKQLSRQ